MPFMLYQAALVVKGAFNGASVTSDWNRWPYNHRKLDPEAGYVEESRGGHSG